MYYSNAMPREPDDYLAEKVGNFMEDRWLGQGFGGEARQVFLQGVKRPARPGG
jgi:hypothetical protein